MSLFVDYKISQQFGLMLYTSDGENSISKQILFPGNLPIDVLIKLTEFLFKKVTDFDIHDLLQKKHALPIEHRIAAHKDALNAIGELISIIRYKDQLPAWSNKLADYSARYSKLVDMDKIGEQLAAEKKKEELLEAAKKAAKLRVRTTEEVPETNPEKAMNSKNKLDQSNKAKRLIGEAILLSKLRNSAMRHIHGNLKPNTQPAKGADGNAVWEWDGTFTANVVNDNGRSYASITYTTEEKWLVQSLYAASNGIVKPQETFDHIEQAVANAITRH